MAAFSNYQQHLAAVPSFLDLSVLLPNSSSPIKMSGLLEEEEGYIDNISTCFPTYSSLTDQHFDQEFPIEKQKTDSSSIVEGNNSSDYQVSTDKMMVMTRKRKNRDGSCLSSSESKDSKRNTRAKKQRNCSDDNDTQKIKSSKDDNKMKKNQKKDPEATTQSGYVHVRARRGEATDSHSLAERVRREKISERLKLLQSLVPGCDKVTSKALMLDEIINYVQSLQHQVEFLSMKLASTSPITYDMGGLSSALLPPVVQLSNTVVTDDDIAAPFTTANSSNLLINSPVSYLLQQAAGGQRSNNNVLCQQDNGNLLWSSVDQQRPTRFFNQSDFNSLCSFQ